MRSRFPGGYQNFLVSDDDPNRILRSYGGNAERLIKAKRRYDSDNLFKSAIPLPEIARSTDDLASAAESHERRLRPFVEANLAIDLRTGKGIDDAKNAIAI